MKFAVVLKERDIDAWVRLTVHPSSALVSG
jgi:hypothetical protein